MRFSPLRVALACVVAVMAMTASAQAATLTVCSGCPNVPPQFGSIQDAVNAANPAGGDEVIVGIGTFAPATIDRPVTLRGAQAGADGRSRNPLAPTETIIGGGGTGLHVLSSHVTIDGFTFTSGVPGIQLSPNHSDYTVVNNVFYENTFGIYAHSDGQDASVIRHNKFELNNFPGAAAGNGIYADQGAGRFTIDENSFLGNLNSGVLFTTTATSGFDNEDIRVTDNEFDRSEEDPTKQNGAGVILARVQDAVISGNRLDELSGSGVYMEASKGIEIAGNEFSNASGWSAIRLNAGNFFFPLAVPNQDVTVTGNDIHDYVNDGPFDGYGIRAADGSHLGELEAHHNRFFGNTVGVSNEDIDAGDRIDAENNWWGCNEGPGDVDCDSIEEAAGPAPGTGDDAIVDSDPWLVLAVASEKSQLALNGETSQISAGLRQNSDGDEVDTPAVPDKPVAFATTLGAIAPPTDVMHLGGAFSELTSGPTAGDADVTAALDNAVAQTTVKLADPPPPPQNGAPGATGATGATGAAGPQGPQGPAGASVLPAPTVAGGETENDNRVRGCSIDAPASAPVNRGSLTVSTTCEEDVRYQAEATVAVPFTGSRNRRGGSSARRFSLRTVRTQVVRSGTAARIRFVLPDSVIQAARRGLAQGRRSSARVKVTATDAAGNRKVLKVTVRLR